jgi:hypothetical protein
LFFNKLINTVVYSENLLNSLEQESILLQIKQCIKRYILAYPYYVFKQLVFIGSNESLLNYLITRLDGFLEIKAQALKCEGRLIYKQELNRNKLLDHEFSSLFLSYGLALRASPFFNETQLKIKN